MILVPAYGRDYTTEEDVKDDYLIGRDFVVQDKMSCWDGKYFSCRELTGKLVKIRYNNQKKIVYISTP